MIEAYAVADVRAVEDLARADLPEGELMQRASRGLAEVVLARLADAGHRRTGEPRVVVLAGRGDNGGDALWAAAHLAHSEVAVGVVTLGRPAAGDGDDADTARAAALEAGAVVLDGDDRAAGEQATALLAEADLVVDGLLGIGGRPGLRDDARRLVDAVPDDAWVLAVDLPSGADPAGESLPDDLAAQVIADETVTFSLVKPVHLLPATEAAVGRLTVVDIGLEDDGAGEGGALQRSGARPVVERLTYDDVRGLWPVPDAHSDKYSRGVVGVVAGSVQYPGAAVLSVLGALGAGPGMIRYLGPSDVQWLVHQRAPEVVTAAGRVQAWVIGSGFDLGSGESVGADALAQRERAHEALASDLPVLVDAGALELVDRLSGRDAPTLLTPHAGELARLLSTLRGEDVDRRAVEAAPLAHARDAARRTGATVLLKGSTTLVVDPDDGVPVRAQRDAPAWVATAGAGDVLGGLCGTLLAAGLAPRDAGSLGALVHGVAADRASAGGPLRILDLAAEVGPAVRSLLSR
ncbi:bifunctional ADP-dependent NAD(P)H-hydrate dehydratase/NAD(P)H-hydrate epimerase [Lapillicoccus jejuensis]|uniref:Bifunctional NAD(P)H-hydrate repair enzyme n=1 Tax=Lapillicoccus jejuensis TaxID=402171 RepID=A0A542E211_9MICO|nr:bifunctional ADP-dependent NAD(P)H-hydrate dehydratase/NAD(P)H-hydrate epimerase [Lapillicoccus jejuensis]TQJ09309.1 hydroxyethylthiazole kinase-like uncharacterized protein yjeF/hydroxyethylthiazole kinase-like uncharacterized protein yjeF [Lapillicoccus jejuensis]